ncbi:MAG TPA: type II toxin-antitoxin system RelE/ParE family toxin [Verrucomicrobiae bacterium]|jgi:toxin ParE1/3/4|nr:type II toxin-antitoxin system RelE/ParE family toxin [Verrucomicrobiae bacterium]
MNLVIEKTPLFHADVTGQFGWYFDEAGEELAWRFFNAADQTLLKLARQPDLGRRRKFRHPMLRDLCSFQVEHPFNKILIFYRVTENTLQAWRLMHGARDLPRRLAEPLL